jgi:FG-GAP repeat.
MTLLHRYSIVFLLLLLFSLGNEQAVAQPSVDLTFGASLTKISEGDVQGIFVQPDGKIFVTGAFKVAGGLARTSVVKLNADGSRPVAADYDGDGRADIAVFRPSTGIWYLLRSTSGFAGYQFGISTDIAIPGSLIP